MDDVEKLARKIIAGIGHGYPEDPLATEPCDCAEIAESEEWMVAGTVALIRAHDEELLERVRREERLAVLNEVMLKRATKAIDRARGEGKNGR